ncbi:MAG TPA: rod shape-determining protein MreD [Acidimicrobiales bacterium]|jgi:rod shape-determining protein MreD|nr:rod shape-determining protein MreD [Acidimicrobiales bacterium]
MTARGALKVLLVVFVTLLVQSTIGVDISIFGVHPDLLLLLPIAAGMAGNAEEGAVMGFVAGLAADLLLPTPFGLSALVGCLVGFAVGYSTGAITREVWWFPAVVALAASAVGVMLYAVMGAVLGQEQFLDLNLAALVGVVAVVNALLAAPAVRAVTWALGPASADGTRSSTAVGRW